MDIDVTELVNEGGFERYSASVAEIGSEAGAITWANARTRALQAPKVLRTKPELTAFVEHARGSGFDAITGRWTLGQIRALFVQRIAGDCREAAIHPNMSPAQWARVETGAADGCHRGGIYPGVDGRIYFTCAARPTQPIGP